MDAKLPTESKSIAEIETLFPDHVILIDEPMLDEHKDLIGGVVVFAGENTKDVYRKLGELKLPRTAIHHTKKDPPGSKYLMNYYVGPDGALMSLFGAIERQRGNHQESDASQSG